MSNVTTARAASSGPAETGVIPRLGHNPWLRLWLVGLSGVAVNQALLVALTEVGGLFYLVSAVIATIGSSTWNYVLADRWAFAGRETRRSAGARYLAFLGLSFATQPVRLPILWGLTELAGVHYAIANLGSLAALALGRAIVADRWVWAPSKSREAVSPAALPHHYAVGELVRISSAVRLPELEWFRAEPTAGMPDIVVRVGWVGLLPTRRVRFEREGERLVYREQLGLFGGNFSLRMGTPIEIVVAPLLALSPHVVYTNIVEAFLRFLLTARGNVLLHAACIAKGDEATLISARTDTGKTSTVISLVRRHGYRFLSDDMTIVTPSGEAIAYPKPMTLSFHTLGAARGGRMSLRERLALSLQSRLHSKTGREVGRALGSGRLPIMSMNAVVQALVPPPKYAIDRLFPCEVGGRARITGVVLIERGEPAFCQRLSLSATLGFLVANTDDAYGFPPFATFAPQIRIEGQDYEALRKRERALIARAIARIERWQLRDPERAWASQLPALVGHPAHEPASAVVPARVPVAVGPGHSWVAEPVGAAVPAAIMPSGDPAGAAGPAAAVGPAAAMPTADPIASPVPLAVD